MGTQKNCLNETVLLNTQNMFKLLGKTEIKILRTKILLNWSYVYLKFNGLKSVGTMIMHHSHLDKYKFNLCDMQLFNTTKNLNKFQTVHKISASRKGSGVSANMHRHGQAFPACILKVWM